MKKNIKRLSLFLAFLMVFMAFSTALVGCNTNEDPTTKKPSGTTAPQGTTTGGNGQNPPPAGTSKYTVSIKSAGGLKLTGVTVNVFSKVTNLPVIQFPGTTDESGLVSFNLPNTTEYYVMLNAVPAGYAYEQKYDFVNKKCDIVLTSSVIPPNGDNYFVPPLDVTNEYYQLGDVVKDFKFTDVDGGTHILSEILEEKDAVVLNFWFYNCDYCVKEFPLLEEAYLEYYDDIEVLALNPIDDAMKISGFEAAFDLDLSFPLIPVASEWSYAFDTSGNFPFTVIIDRYGVICMVERGAILTDDAFPKIFAHFAAADYEQMLITSAADLTPQEKPTESMPTDDELNAALGTTGLDFRAETSAELGEFSWPFIVTEYDGVTCIKPSNSGKNYTYAFLHVDITLEKDQAIVFDYLASTEYNADILATRINGEDIYQISGNFGTGWSKCCTYVADEAGTYTLTFWFLKDTSTSEGEDAVFIKNLRIVDKSEVDVATYIPRDAAKHENPDGDGYQTYPDLFLNEVDGYYHVGSVNGPILLANLLGRSLFNAGEYSINDYAILAQLYYDYLETATDAADAKSFYAEASGNGYKFYKLVNGEKQYLELYWQTTLSQIAIKYVAEADAKCVYTYNAELGAWTTKVNSVEYYLGVSNEFRLVTAYRIGTLNASTNGITHFPLVLTDADGAVVTAPESAVAYNLGLNQTVLGEYLYLNGQVKDLDTVLTEYLIDASNATINGLCAVNEELKQLLMLVAERVGLDGSATRDKQWLQTCRYYDAYATAHLADPTQGLSFHSAFIAVENEPNTVYYDGRLIMPRGLFYKFVPTVSGVYNVVSNSDSSVDGWIFLESDTEMPTLTYDKLQRVWEDYNNCSMYMYMEAGRSYYINIAFSDYYQQGSFTFTVKNVGETFELFRYCSNGFFTSRDEASMDEYNLITGGLMKIVYDAEDDCFYQYYGDDKNNRNPKPLYADFTNLTPLFSHSIEAMISLGAFDFSKTEDDETILKYMELYPDDYEEKLMGYFGENYDQEYVDDVKNGIYHGTMLDYSKTDKDVLILEYMEDYPETYEDELKALWGDDYDQSYVDDVKNGVYHGDITNYARNQRTKGVDYTAIMLAYLNGDDIILGNEDAPEMNGCIVVNMEIATILQHLVDKYSFRGVENAWSKLCCFYEQFGADVPVN
ncbi:MAG: TlpA family protein disulfide reductase [Clostridia bacterium]|nr:TlpA family protein disulfide reductase [Clostridia bacterium]